MQDDDSLLLRDVLAAPANAGGPRQTRTSEPVTPPAESGVQPAAAKGAELGVKWRVRIADKEYGPYTRSRLIEFLKEGRIVAASLLACGNDTEFVRADRHPQLRWDFNPPARKRQFGGAGASDAETPLSNYFIAARLVSSSQSFERALSECGRYARAGGDMWVLRSRVSVQQLRNRLSVFMSPNDQFVIVNSSRDRLAWFNLGAENDIAVRTVWDSEED